MRCRRPRRRRNSRNGERHLADRRVRRTGRPGAGCIPFDRNRRSQLLGELLTQAHERGMGFSGVVWRSAGPAPRGIRCGCRGAARGRDRQPAQRVHAAQGGDVKLPGGLWIVTERAVACEAGERSTRSRPHCGASGAPPSTKEPALRCRLVDCDGSPEAVQPPGLLADPVADPELAVRQGKLLASGCCRGAQRSSAGARGQPTSLAPTERGAIDNLRLTETEVPPPDEGYVQVRVEAAGLNFRDVLNVLGLYPGIRARSAVTSPASSRNWATASPDSRWASAFTASCRARSPAGSMCRLSSCWRRCPTGLSAVAAQPFPRRRSPPGWRSTGRNCNPGTACSSTPPAVGGLAAIQMAPAARRHRLRDRQHLQTRHVAADGREVRL